MKKQQRQPKLQRLQNETKQAKQHFNHLATDLLTNGAENAFELLKQADEDYDKKWKASARYADKLEPGAWNLVSTLFSYSTIVDMYYELSDDLQAKWMAIPELQIWKAYNGTRRNKKG